MPAMAKKAFNFETLGLGLVLLLTLIAELYRFQGYLILDLFVPFFVVLWLIKKLYKKELSFPGTIYPAFLFIGIGAASLLVHSGKMNFPEFLASFFYVVRWISFFLLSVVVWNQSKEGKRLLIFLLALFTGLLCIAGFVQLHLVPDFTSYEDLGWDPHQNRLLSTWFDPNFVGGFLAFMFPILLGFALDKKIILNTRQRLFILGVCILSLIAIFLTLSRSAYLALIVSLFIYGLLRSVKTLFIIGMLFLMLFSVSSDVRSRFTSLITNIESAVSDDYTLPDASARLRYESWSEAWHLFLDEPLIGQGYNRYKYAALELGTLKDTEIHSASGSDSSLLNVLATTGILGFLPFLTTYLILAVRAWKNRHQGFSLGGVAALSGLFVHSIFVNSLLFPLFMAPFWIMAGLLEAPLAKNKNISLK